MKTMTKDLQHCIDNCLKCYETCRETISYCLEKGGEHAEPEHINLLLNCADICQTSANFMLSNSNLHVSTCKVCAEVCTKCAEDCERIGRNDEQMKECIQICRQCAESCKQMSK